MPHGVDALGRPGRGRDPPHRLRLHEEPGKRLAERLVYRRPRPLVVRAVEGKKPGGEITLSIQNEQGRPVAAALGISIIDAGKDKTPRPVAGGPDLFHAFFSDGELQDPNLLKGVDLDLADGNAAADGTPPPSGSPVPAALIDLALGCQGEAGRAKLEPEPSRLVLFDNLGELQAQYEATLSEYRAQRTQVVNALIMLSFFGGLALALFVTMLALLRIVWGSRLWLPTVVATVCCVVVTAVSNDPSRMKPVEATAVGFAPCTPPPEPKDKGRSEPAAATASDVRLRNLAEKVSKVEGDAAELKADRFAVRQYSQPDGVVSAGRDSAKPLAWYPLLIAGPDGRVTIPPVASAAGQTPWLVIDAHCDGRIESCELPMK